MPETNPTPAPAATPPAKPATSSPWNRGVSFASQFQAAQQQDAAIEQAFHRQYGCTRKEHVDKATRSVLPEANSSARNTWLSSQHAPEPEGRSNSHPINTYHRLERQAKEQASRGNYSEAHSLVCKAMEVEEGYINSTHGGVRDQRHQTAHNVRRARANSLLGSKNARAIAESEAVAKAKLEVAQFEQQFKATKG